MTDFLVTRERAMKSERCEHVVRATDKALGQDWLDGKPVHIIDMIEVLDVDTAVDALRLLGRKGARIAARATILVAKRALPKYERVYPDDKLARECVEKAEICLETTTHENWIAANAAAYKKLFDESRVACFSVAVCASRVCVYTADIATRVTSTTWKRSFIQVGYAFREALNTSAGADSDSAAPTDEERKEERRKQKEDLVKSINRAENEVKQ